MRVAKLCAIGVLVAGCGDADQTLTVGSTGDATVGSDTGGPTSDTPTTDAPTGDPTDAGETDTTAADPPQTVTTDDPPDGTTEVETTNDPPDPPDPPDRPSCDDNEKNGDETSVDCGGSCKPCPPKSKPDLFVDYFYVDDHFVEAGDGTEMHFGVANAGKVDTEYQFYLRVVMTKNDVIGDEDDILLFNWLYQYTVEAEDESLWKEYIFIPETAYDGGYFIGIDLDYTDIIEESDETNNSLFDPDSLTVWNNPAPANTDLAPSNVLAVQHNVLQGAAASFDFEVANLGPGDVANYSVGLYYSTDTTITKADTLICTYEDLDGLAGMAQEAQKLMCNVPAVVGSRYFGVIVDPGQALEEIDETNNIGADPAVVTITVPNVDLQVSAVKSADVTLDVGQPVTLTATVKNAGTDPSPKFGVSYYLSKDPLVTDGDTFICSTDIGGLGAGAQTDAAPTCAIPGVQTGSYWLGAIADGAGLITETNEGNNVAAAVGQVIVTAPNVDLEYYLLWDNMANQPSPGDTVKYHVQIRNNGNAASPSPIAVTIVYSLDMDFSLLDPAACTVDVGKVPAVTVTEFTFDCKIPNVPPGWYFHGVIIDSNNKIPETDETNNVGGGAGTNLIQ